MEETINLLNENVMDLIRILGDPFSSYIKRKSREVWKPPDASLKDSKATLAMVLKDDSRRVIHLDTKYEEARTPLKVEMNAFPWALQVAMTKPWSKIQWSSNAQLCIAEINSVHDLHDWNTTYMTLLCKQSLKAKGWPLEWNERPLID
ncbi:hypothetical protein FNV43_RR19084 [Rhamnella rubrinervis]|uniref:Uncharacterized protein n=1 Tax=Rhamnella rubrinervis TaxID=2594499 RepID=A0A8K0E4Z7_9ROSA|nr:hypothetical protein FNV43_RR19084 [Rhamnella rubrinervis]